MVQSHHPPVRRHRILSESTKQQGAKQQQQQQHKSQRYHGIHAQQPPYVVDKPSRSKAWCVGLGCFIVLGGGIVFVRNPTTVSLLASSHRDAIGQSGNKDAAETTTVQSIRYYSSITNSFSSSQRQRRATDCNHKRTAHDIRNCYATKYVKQDFPNRYNCTEIVNWEQVQNCLTGRYSYRFDSNSTPLTTSHGAARQAASSLASKNSPANKKKKKSRPIREIHILGERHSGTKYVTSMVQQCFASSTSAAKSSSRQQQQRRVHRDFLRSKHFFQPIVRGDYTSSLMIVIVRDPVEWIAAMVEKPYHSPFHIQGFDTTTDNKVLPLHWREFVSRPWTIPNATTLSPQDNEIRQAMEHNATWRNKGMCQERFMFHQVVPCQLDNLTAQQTPWNIPLQKWRGYHPVYEQQQQRRRDTGSSSSSSLVVQLQPQPYDHILQLRADKIVNWILEMPLLMQLGGFLVVRYEDLMRQGNEYFLRQIAQLLLMDDDDDDDDEKNSSSLVLPKSCVITGPQPERLGRRRIPHEFRAWIEENLDIETERLIGYR